MNKAKTNRRFALHAGVASSLVLTALAGCQTPASMPTTGAAQAQAYPGTTGERIASLGATRRFEAAPTVLSVAGASATINSINAANVLDGDVTTAWSTGNSHNPYLTLTLAKSATLTSLDLKASPVGNYVVDVSDDGATWTTAIPWTSNTSWNVETKPLPAGTQGKFVRFHFINNGQQVMAFEAAVHGNDTAASSIVQAASVVATASSSAAGYPASAAVDGNTATQWASDGTANPTLTIDNGAAGSLASVAIKIAPGPTYAVDGSADGTTWTQVLANQSNTTWNVETKALPAGTSARYLRFRFTAASKVQVFEVHTTGTTSTVPSTSPTTAPASAPTTAPITAPVSTPTPVATTTPASAQPVASNGVAINVNIGHVLHPATSHILGTCRNHVASDFPNGAAKLAKLQELTPTWGEHKYLYRIGHGPTDGRNDYSYMTGFHFEQTWDANNGYPYDDIRNALKDANAIGADEMHVVNFGTSDADEAGRYVSFLNHAGDANRAAHPIAQQNVQMFELGNEISWSMVRGHDQYAPNETAYAQRAKTFAQKMRAASDVPIKIGAVASTNSNWFGSGWSGGATTVKNILTTMGPDVDFLIYHGYPSWPMTIDGNLETIMAQNEWNKQKLEKEIKPAITANAGGRDVFLANTEFFTNLYNDVTHSRGMFGAMFSADTLLLAMNEDIRTSVQFCFDHKDMADASFFIGNDPTATTAIFKFQKMLAQHWGDNIVETSGQNLPTKAVTGASASITMPKLSFSAATSGNKTYVMVLNRTNDSDVASAVNVGFTPSAVTAYTLSGTTGWDSANADVATTNGVSLGGLTFKRASVTILEITK